MKAFFLSRLFREKVLLLALVLIVAATWLSSVSGRVGKLWREIRITEALYADQRGWLDQRTRIESAAREAIQYLDPAKTYDGGRLQSEIDAIARRTGLSNYSAENVQTERSSQFSMNSMRLEIRNAEYPTLVKFYLELVKHTPYIGIEQFRITATGGKHNASLRVTSVEIAK